jgi:hypothetical protein
MPFIKDLKVTEEMVSNEDTREMIRRAIEELPLQAMAHSSASQKPKISYISDESLRSSTDFHKECGLSPPKGQSSTDIPAAISNFASVKQNLMNVFPGFLPRPPPLPRGEVGRPKNALK